jgi:uncharacterized protein YacL (UPF0231 family)
MKLEFHRDSDGAPRARVTHGTDAGRAVSGFLESDLQDSAEAAREILRAVDAVEAGREPSWERTGNAHTLTLSPEGAMIQDENDEDSKPHALSLVELRRAVADWISFLEGGRGA